MQQAVAQVIHPIFDKTFSEFSYGFRPKRSQYHAVSKLRKYIEEGKRIAEDVDLSKFFDRVNHDFLDRKLLARRMCRRWILESLS
ncbi:reverse transcriptase domain-containing protein [Microbulbifer sp. DLAB2-AF]|uniref:reverse transcriptase domain-containing protein n=1 Tax=Microbulbifer sp. DLAB2-AF TaxID=3243395 RepID=UPI004039F42F